MWFLSSDLDISPKSQIMYSVYIALYRPFTRSVAYIHSQVRDGEEGAIVILDRIYDPSPE